jgi:hypothetical protein
MHHAMDRPDDREKAQKNIARRKEGWQRVGSARRPLARSDFGATWFQVRLIYV